MLSQFDGQDYVFIHLIGSIPDENRNTDKIGCYYQISNGILIRDFAIDFLKINPLYVNVYAYGNKQYYDKFIHTNNKIYYQIDKDNIFQIDVDSSQFEFDYFTDFTVSLNKIEQMILNNEYSTVVFFLDDHGNEGHFSQIGYFQLYKMILKFPNNDFLIFNDSCNSGSMIDLIKSYNQIHESNILKSIAKDIGGQILFSFMNLFSSILCSKDSDKIENPIKEAKRLIKFYQAIKKINNNDPSIKKLELNDEIKIYALIGLTSEQNIKDFRFVFDSFETLGNEHDLLTRYIKSKEIFNEHNFDVIENFINDNVQNFIDTLKILYEDRKIIDFNLLPHQNLEIITSTDAKNVCFSYTSIRVNEITKVNPGSPAMSAFIKEIFLKKDKTPFNFENIRREMTESNEGHIIYPTKPEMELKNQRKKRQWISLFPQHYKENRGKSYSFVRDEDVNLKVAALRTISFLINQKLLKVAKDLAPEIDSNNLNPSNDSLADIVAISAILDKSNNAIPIIKKGIVNNKLFLKHQSMGIKTIFSIYKCAFTFSKEPIKMTAIILNCLQKAIRRVIYDNMISIQEKSGNACKKILTSDEISLLMKNPSNKSINDEINLIKIFSPAKENDSKYKFINDIENATFSLINSQSILPSFIISSLFTKEFKEEFIQKDNIYLQFYDNEIVNILDEKKKLERIKEYSEQILLSKIKSSFIHLDLICDAYIKNDAMRIVAQKLQSYSSLYLMNNLTKYLGDSKNQTFVEFIIQLIEEEISILDISTFFIPLILSFVDEKVIIHGLYASIANTQSNCYQKVFEILNGIKNKLNDIKYNDLIKFLSDLNNVADKQTIQEKVEQIKNEIRKEVQISIKRVVKIVNLSIKKARGNISKRLNIKIIKEQIEQYNFYLESIKKDKYTNKYHTYLYSSISILKDVYYNYSIDSICSEILSGGFISNDSITNTKDLYERAANELFTVAYLFDISDKSCCNMKEEKLKKFNSDLINMFTSSVMAARYLNIVEIAPITDVLDTYKLFFEVSEGDEPNIKELMGLHAACSFILLPKDKDRIRFRTKSKISDENKKDDDIEDDPYYSNGYYEETDEIPHRSFQLDLNDEISFYNKSHKITIQPKILYHKDQIGGAEIKSLQKELNLGHGDWTYEAWIAFIYCFNKRMSHIGIKFDPENDYNDAKYPITIGDAILVIEQFYPIYRIRYFWKNEQRIKKFVGKYSNHRYEILRALVRSFDDVDRIVTPLHMFQETFEERTLEKLNMIFDY